MHLKSCNVNGNEMKTKKHVPGVLEVIANAILKALMAAAKFIVELASAFIDFIWSAIEGISEPDAGERRLYPTPPLSTAG